jgi:hypothetical protein
LVVMAAAASNSIKTAALLAVGFVALATASKKV